MALVKEKAMAGVRKGPWTEQEDVQLMCYVGLFGERRWDFIAKVSGLNRTGKSCRLRWVNYLHPGLKRGRLSPHEERLVLHLHSRWGNRWSRIARKLPGRTDNEIKNYWRTHMRKKAQERKRSSSSPSSPQLSPSGSGGPPLEAGTTGWRHDIMSTASGCCSSLTTTTTGLEGEEGVKGYSMDQIWNEIASPSDCKGEACNMPAGPPLPSPQYDSLWKMDDDELKMFASVEGGDFLVPGYLTGSKPYG